MIPGSNLLGVALQVIATESINYYQATGRSLNEIGQYVTTYAMPVTIRGSFQPVPRSRYEVNNLDLQKSYFTFYTSSDLIDIQRDVSPDYITFGSQTYQCISNNDWYQIDGWVGIIVVLVSGQAD